MNSRSVVLYVNENPKARRLLASILEDRGFQVRTADGALEALKFIHDNCVALALLDYQMPEMSGATAQEIRGLDPALPIILISGLSFLSAGELVHVDAHMGQGSTLEDLTDTMRALMDPEPIADAIGAHPKSVADFPGAQ
jgi:FixJ family two-component response regulator